MKRRFFTHIDGFEKSRFIEYREDGARFSHKNDGTIVEHEGDGRLSNGDASKHPFISHTLEAIEGRVKKGIWREITISEAFQNWVPKELRGEEAPKTACEEVW